MVVIHCPPQKGWDVFDYVTMDDGVKANAIIAVGAGHGGGTGRLSYFGIMVGAYFSLPTWTEDTMETFLLTNTMGDCGEPSGFGGWWGCCSSEVVSTRCHNSSKGSKPIIRYKKSKLIQQHIYLMFFCFKLKNQGWSDCAWFWLTAVTLLTRQRCILMAVRMEPWQHPPSSMSASSKDCAGNGGLEDTISIVMWLVEGWIESDIIFILSAFWMAAVGDFERGILLLLSLTT